METLRYYFFWFFINLDLLAIAFVLFAAIAFLLHKQKFGRKLILIAVLPLVIVNLSPIGPWMIMKLENMVPRPTPPHASEIEGIIQLGGAFAIWETAERQEPVYNIAGSRLMSFIELSHKYPNAKLILTGNPIESNNSEKVLLAHNLDKSRIIVEAESKNTEDHPKNLEKLIDKDKTYLLVTSAFHMPRGLLLFQAAGYKVIPYPVDYHTPGKISVQSWASYVLQRMAPMAFKQACIEWAGLTNYYFNGLTKEWYPKGG